jgi:hypothetical protein
MDVYRQVEHVETAAAAQSYTAELSEKQNSRREQGMRLFLWVWLPVLGLLGLAWIISANTDISIRQLMQDPTTVLEAPFYIGLVSNIGILLWAAAAATCLFIPTFLPRLINQETRLFLLASGLLTGLLLFDDFFLLHDEILPIHLGISGKLYGIVYILLILLYLYRFQATILQSPYTILILALGFFATSAAVDLTHSLIDNELAKSQTLLLEDGAKLMGVAHWLAYFAVISRTIGNKLPDRPPV